ncbi:MAG: MFS transporter [Bacteroidetes bacterium]|nr:MFS transporter [Bacteroidota bacterium]
MIKAERVGNYRWVIATLLLFSTTINYMDRQVISYVKDYFCTPIAKGGFGWTDNQYSYITSFFTAFYAGITIVAGLVVDKIGTKLGLALSLITWSIFGILNAFAGSSVVVHTAVRSLFGIGEAGNFPASIKAVAEWFPKKERALATGIFNSGANIGAMIAALFVPWCLIHWGEALGWKMAYIITGSVGFLWLIFWFLLYSKPAECKYLSKKEFDLIHEDDLAMHVAPSEDVAVNEKISWRRLFRYPQTWAFFWGKFMTDGIWWFLLFWLPDYLKKQFGMTIHQIMWPTFIVYAISIIGSTYGGNLPRTMINRGMPVFKARMTAMFVIALLPLVLLLTQYFGDKAVFGNYAATLAIAMICIGAAAHQAWSANLFTTVSDMFPKKAIGSVTGIGGMAGGIGGVIIQRLSGILNTAYHTHPQTAYLIMFVMCAFAYITAWAIIRLLTRRPSNIVV